MSKTIRFGKKLPIPSTAQIKHELRLIAAANDLLDAGFFDADQPRQADGELRELAGSLSRKHGLSFDRAQMIVDRFAADRHTLNVAAQQLASARI